MRHPPIPISQKMINKLRNKFKQLLGSESQWGHEDTGPHQMLNDELVSSLLSDFSRYVVEGNMPALQDLFSPDVSAREVNITHGLKTEQKLDRSSFLGRIARTLDYRGTYNTYDISIEKINISGPTKSIADCKVEFEYTVENKTVTTKCHEQFTVEIRNGHPRITEFLIETT